MLLNVISIATATGHYFADFSSPAHTQQLNFWSFLDCLDNLEFKPHIWIVISNVSLRVLISLTFSKRSTFIILIFCCWAWTYEKKTFELLSGIIKLIFYLGFLVINMLSLLFICCHILIFLFIIKKRDSLFHSNKYQLVI